MPESGTPVGDEAERWLTQAGGLHDREGLTPRHRSAEVIAVVVSPAVELVRNEATILSNVLRLPEIMREQLKYPHQRVGFLGLTVLTPIMFGVVSWIYFDSPFIPGMILGAYMPIRRMIARSLIQ